MSHVPSGQRARGAFDEVGKHRDAEAEVRRPQHGDALAGCIERGALRVRKPRRPADQRAAVLDAIGEHAVEGLGQAEVDHDVALRCGGEFARCELRHAIDHALANLARHRTHEGEGVRLFRRQAQQRLSHPAVGAVQEQSNR